MNIEDITAAKLSAFDEDIVLDYEMLFQDGQEIPGDICLSKKEEHPTHYGQGWDLKLCDIEFKNPRPTATGSTQGLELGYSRPVSDAFEKDFDDDDF